MRLFPNALCHFLGKFHAFFCRHILDGDKRDHVHSAHAGVFALVDGEVDQRRRFFRDGDGGVRNTLGVS